MNSSILLLLVSGCISPALQRELDARKVYEPYPAAYTPSQEIAAYALQKGGKVTVVNGHSAYLVSGPNHTIVRYEINGFPNYYPDDALQYTHNRLPYWCVDNGLDGVDGIVFKEGHFKIMDKRAKEMALHQCVSILTTT